MNDDFKIEANVPPPSVSSPGQPTKYPLKEMNVGDSFTFDLAIRHRMSSAITHTQHTRGFKFTTRTIDANTCRCWRIA